MELSPGMEVWKGNQDQMELSMGPKDQMELSMGPGASACLCLSYIHTLIALFHKKHGFKAVAITLVAVFGVFQYSNSLLISLTGVCDNGGVAVDQVLTHCNADLFLLLFILSTVA